MDYPYQIGNHNKVFVVNPTNVNANLKNGNNMNDTSPKSARLHQCEKVFCMYALFMFWVPVAFQWEKCVINQVESSGYLKLSPYKQHCSYKRTASYE